MKNSIKKEIISGVSKILNDFVKIKSLYENNRFYDNDPLRVPAIFNQIDTDEIFTRVIDALDKNLVGPPVNEIGCMEYLFRSLNKDTYELINYNYFTCAGIASDLVEIIEVLQKTHKLLK